MQIEETQEFQEEDNEIDYEETQGYQEEEKESDYEESQSHQKVDKEIDNIEIQNSEGIYGGQLTDDSDGDIEELSRRRHNLPLLQVDTFQSHNEEGAIVELLEVSGFSVDN